MKKARMSNLNSPFSGTVKPDIPLRQPLEEESKLKRRAAKEIFEKEKWEKVMQNKLKIELEEEKHIEEKKVSFYFFFYVDNACAEGNREALQAH